MRFFRWPVLGSAFLLAASVVSCGGVLLGEPVPCEHDANCSDGFICEGALTRVCVAAIECTGDSQCPVGSSCIERTVAAPDSPFEAAHVSKLVCDCLDDCGAGGFNAGGEPAGGQGGEPAGGQGGEPAGGQGGSGGAPRGGAGGQGGAQ
jgi:hypothetical protein